MCGVVVREVVCVGWWWERWDGEERYGVYEGEMMVVRDRMQEGGRRPFYRYVLNCLPY